MFQYYQYFHFSSVSSIYAAGCCKYFCIASCDEWGWGRKVFSRWLGNTDLVSNHFDDDDDQWSWKGWYYLLAEQYWNFLNAPHQSIWGQWSWFPWGTLWAGGVPLIRHHLPLGLIITSPHCVYPPDPAPIPPSNWHCKGGGYQVTPLLDVCSLSMADHQMVVAAKKSAGATKISQNFPDKGGKGNGRSRGLTIINNQGSWASWIY